MNILKKPYGHEIPAIDILKTMMENRVENGEEGKSKYIFQTNYTIQNSHFLKQIPS